MAQFHLPYHFIPWSDQNRKHDVTRSKFEAGQPPHVTHDRYVEGTYNGRLVCRLTTQTPIVVGGELKEGKPATVQNYRLNGKEAIPASSLRGVISSLAEAASNSAMRVFKSDRVYSYRKSMNAAEAKLSAMGMILPHRTKKDTWVLWPLVIPTLKEDPADGKAKLPKRFWRYFPLPAMKVYLGDFDSIRRENNPHKNRPFRQYAAMQLSYREWQPGYWLQNDPYQYRRGPFVLSQLPAFGGTQDALPDYDPQRHPMNQYWVKGVVRALGCWPENRQESMPPGKKHELFLPLPLPTIQKWPGFEIPTHVVKTFHALCDERTEATRERYFENNKNPLLPFEPYGTREERYREDDPEKSKIRLKDGDIVYFDVGPDGEICEISFSAIWRGLIPGTAKNFFPAELLPFNHEKNSLTAADLLFGFVEDREALKKENKSKDDRNFGMALASRVQFSAAQVQEAAQVRLLPQQLRKILDSPKPPSPSFYFRNKGNATGAIRKFALNPDQHQAQGRKLYLHHSWRTGQAPWKGNPDTRLEQKAWIQPIDAGQEFYFHVDVQNLSRNEFALLLFALSPGAGFQHKIGMGKAIGLGSVKIEPLAFCEIDRQQRYSRGGLSAPRYGKVTAAAERAELRVENWPQRYAQEGEAAQNADAGLLQLRDEYAQSIPANIRRALELIGNPANLRFPVTTPYVEGQAAGGEDRTFEWNVANDNSQNPQALTPITGGTKELPALRTLRCG
jgi:CRISPR-associated protein (TIGR03986 family)